MQGLMHVHGTNSHLGTPSGRLGREQPAGRRVRSTASAGPSDAYRSLTTRKVAVGGVLHRWRREEKQQPGGGSDGSARRPADTERVDQLLERSSRGTLGARRLRRRSPSAQVAAARRIYQLRNRIVHCAGRESAAAAMEWADYLIELATTGRPITCSTSGSGTTAMPSPTLATLALLSDPGRRSPVAARRDDREASQDRRTRWLCQRAGQPAGASRRTSIVTTGCSQRIHRSS